MGKRILPAPDEYGNYWLGSKPGNNDCGPAIFPSGGPSNPVHPGKFFATRGDQCGVVCEGSGIKYFSSAAAAMSELVKLGAV